MEDFDIDSIPVKLEIAPIEFRACAGLGNRMRATVSAICLAEDLGRPLHLIWNVDAHCGCTFEDVFDPSSLPGFVTVYNKISRISMAYSQEVRGGADIDIFMELDNSEPIIIHSHQKFYCPRENVWLMYLRSLKPSMCVSHMLSRRLAAIDSACVGVHIRRTDHKKAITHSTRGAFEKELEKEEGTFVLVTDSADERSWFEETYPGRLLYSTRVFDRRTVVGMQHAMTDFLALTSCKRIVGSVGSSFGELAALYGDTPFRAAASFSNP